MLRGRSEVLNVIFPSVSAFSRGSVYTPYAPLSVFSIHIQRMSLWLRAVRRRVLPGVETCLSGLLDFWTWSVLDERQSPEPRNSECSIPSSETVSI